MVIRYQRNLRKGTILQPLNTALNPRKNLQRFEEKTGIKQKIARYLHIHGKTEKEITTILKTKTSRLNIHEAGTLPTIAGIKSELETVLEILKEYAQIDDEVQTQYYTLKRICEKL